MALPEGLSYEQALAYWEGMTPDEKARTPRPEPQPGQTTQPLVKDSAIIRAYGTYLGRDPDASEIEQWRNNPAFEAAIAGSPEARYAVANARGEVGPAWQYSPLNPANNPAAAAGGGAAAAGGGGGGRNGFRDAWLGSGGRTVVDLQNFVKAHPEYGVTLGGSKGEKVYGPNGEFWADAVKSAGKGGEGAQWLDDPSGGGGGGDGRMQYSYEEFKGMDPFSYAEFVPPTGLTDENAPGFRERMALGQQGLERAAASRGTVLGGGTLKELNRYAQDFASNEFNNTYNRALSDYNTNRSNAYDTYRTNFDNAYKTWAGNLGAGQIGFTNNLASDQQRYSQLYGTAALGLQATGQYSSAAQNYNNTLADIYNQHSIRAGENLTSAANANAAAVVGGAANWGNALNTIGNGAALAGLYGSSIYGNQSPTRTTVPRNYPTGTTGLPGPIPGLPVYSPYGSSVYGPGG